MLSHEEELDQILENDDNLSPSPSPIEIGTPIFNENMEESTTTTAQLNEQFIAPNEEQEPLQFTNNSISPDDFIEESTITFQSTESITVNLQQYTELNKMPDTPYNNVSPKAFTTAIDQVYEEMVTWRKTLFLVPTGKAGKTFIKLISEWLNNFNIADSFQVL